MPAAVSTKHLALPTWDIAASLPVVIDDGSEYVYGAGLGEMLSGGNTYYYLADGLGSTMAIVGATGAVQKSYTYDVYGKPSATGTLANEFDFAGQQTDPTALQYLRARYMDPETGTFVRRDPMAAKSKWSRSDFGYAGGNPTSMVNPSGLAHVIAEGGGPPPLGCEPNRPRPTGNIGPAIKEPVDAPSCPVVTPLCNREWRQVAEQSTTPRWAEPPWEAGGSIPLKYGIGPCITYLGAEYRIVTRTYQHANDDSLFAETKVREWTFYYVSGVGACVANASICTNQKIEWSTTWDGIADQTLGSRYWRMEVGR